MHPGPFITIVCRFACSDALAANRGPPVDLKTLTPGQLCEELHNRVAARVKERLMGGDPWAQDPVGMHLPGYRERYYEVRVLLLVVLVALSRG